MTSSKGAHPDTSDTHPATKMIGFAMAGCFGRHIMTRKWTPFCTQTDAVV
jgi:hypothetical protein